MNCKPGQMAMIVRSRPGDCADANALVQAIMGRSVRVMHVTTGQMWRIEEPINIKNVPLSGGRILLNADIVGIEDYYLMPIDGLPVTDDVTDEVTA